MVLLSPTRMQQSLQQFELSQWSGTVRYVTSLVKK